MYQLSWECINGRGLCHTCKWVISHSFVPLIWHIHYTCKCVKKTTLTYTNVLRKTHGHTQSCWGKHKDTYKCDENNTWTHTNVFRKTYWHIQMCLEKHACVKENAYVSTRTHTCMCLVCVKSKIEMGHVTCMNLSGHTSEENHVANTHDMGWLRLVDSIKW
jgi:hypothetical protein